MDTHVIFEPVTDVDKNLDVLAAVKADCTFRQYFNLCNTRCSMCRTQYNFTQCYEQLAMCDQLRVDEHARELSLRRIVQHKIFRRNRLKDRALLIFIFALLLVFFFVGVGLVNAEPAIMKVYQNDSMITDILIVTRSNVYDRNGDYLVNCIDYSMQFKKEWDKKYPSKNCEIVRNNNGRNKFHHLFIRCRNHELADWVYVEPQGTARCYDMYDFWKDKYECFWNIYGETELWMRMCVR